MEEERYEEAEAVIRYWLTSFPKSANAHDTLADLYAAQGQLDQELEARTRAVEWARTHQDSRIRVFEKSLERLKRILDGS